MTAKEQTPERELNLIQLSLYLQEFPTSAYDLAIDHYAKYLQIVDDYKLLRMEFDSLQQENIRLKAAKNHPSLPPFLSSNREVS